jgi:hypothetical protein
LICKLACSIEFEFFDRVDFGLKLNVVGLSRLLKRREKKTIYNIKSKRDILVIIQNSLLTRDLETLYLQKWKWLDKE